MRALLTNRITRQQVLAFSFLAFLVLLIYNAALMFAPFVIPVLWAAIIARTTIGLHTKLTHLLRGRETLSASLLTFVVMFLGVVPAAYFSFVLVQQSIVAYQALAEWAERDGLIQLPQYLRYLPIVGDSLQTQVNEFLKTGDMQGGLLGAAKPVSSFLVGHIAGWAGNAVGVIMDFFVMLFVLFFFYRDGDRMYRRLYRLVPLEERHKREFVTRLDRTLTTVVKGVVFIAITQGILAGMAYWALSVPFPLVLAALTALLSVLPVGGTALIWAPAALYLFATAATWKAITMAAWGAVVVVALVDNLLKPQVMGRGSDVPMLFLFLSILGGLALYGVVGAFLGPILLAILVSAVRIYEDEYQQGPTRSDLPSKRTAASIPDGVQGAVTGQLLPAHVPQPVLHK
jgi:predicted PurR-regulated permease PerM